MSFDDTKIVIALYRPFTKKWLYFDRLVNERVYGWSRLQGRALWVKVGAAWPFFVLMSDVICDLLPQGGSQCFHLSHIQAVALDRFRCEYSDDAITKEDVFHYVYAVLHHPVYRERYAENLKRELPRIPLAAEFGAFATAGKELARLHVQYEFLNSWPLESVEKKGVPFSQRVTKMTLNKGRSAIQINQSLTFAGIPEEAFCYRLGSRSALEWIIDQYQVKRDSDPNREDNPGYIVRLVGQVVRVSVETTRIIQALADYEL